MKRKYLKWTLIAFAVVLVSLIILVLATGSVRLKEFGYVDDSVEIQLIPPAK